MGHSYTVPILGFAPLDRDPANALEDINREAIYCARTILEAHQEAAKAEKRGTPIERWSWQTTSGQRMLHADAFDQGAGYVSAARLPKVSTVPCPPCRGEGCGICNFAGFTTKRWLAGYRPWQLEPK
jgi:hypothetical protein